MVLVHPSDLVGVDNRTRRVPEKWLATPPQMPAYLQRHVTPRAWPAARCPRAAPATAGRATPASAWPARLLRTRPCPMQ